MCKNSKIYSRVGLLKWAVKSPECEHTGLVVTSRTSQQSEYRAVHQMASANQKSASSLNVLSVAPDITPIRWYSPTLFSKKLVFPSREMFSMKSKGFSAR